MATEAKEIKVNMVAAYINDLSEEIGTWAQGHGFREDWEIADQLEAIVSGDEHLRISVLSAAAVALRTNILGMKLMLATSELSEALETLRDHGSEGILGGDGNFGEELGDCVIRLLDLAHMIKSPIGDEIIRKVDKNVDRPHKHGRKV